MATIHIALASRTPRAASVATLNRDVAPSAPDAVPALAQTMASEASSIVSTINASGSASVFSTWIVTALGGSVWIEFGPTPVAAPGRGWLLLAGQTREFTASPGQKVAVADAV